VYLCIRINIRQILKRMNDVWKKSILFSRYFWLHSPPPLANTGGSNTIFYSLTAFLLSRAGWKSAFHSSSCTVYYFVTRLCLDVFKFRISRFWKVLVIIAKIFTSFFCELVTNRCKKSVSLYCSKEHHLLTLLRTTIQQHLTILA